MIDSIEVTGTIKSHHGDGAHDGEEITLRLEAFAARISVPKLNLEHWAEFFESHAHDHYFQAQVRLADAEWELGRITAGVVAQTAPAQTDTYDYSFILTNAHIEAPDVRRFLELQIMVAHQRAVMQRLAPIYFYTLGVSGLTDADCDAFVEEFFIHLSNHPESERRYFAHYTRHDMTAHINDAPDEE